MERVLYRALLRSGQNLDKSPLCKTLLIARPQALYDRSENRALEVKTPEKDKADLASQRLDRVLADFNGGEFYRPTSSMAALVRDQFRTSSAAQGAGVDLDYAFLAIKTLESAVANGAKLVDPEPATDLPAAFPQMGCLELTDSAAIGRLLVCHPVSCLPQPTLHRSVILIFESNEDYVGGIVINKPMGQTLGELMSEQSESPALKTFFGNPIYTAGDVMAGSILILHPHPGIRESKRVADGLYITANFMDAAVMVERGEAHAQDFMLMAGHCGWSQVQLDVELERNVWFVAKADDERADERAADEDEAGEGEGGGWGSSEVAGGQEAGVGGAEAGAGEGADSQGAAAEQEAVTIHRSAAGSGGEPGRGAPAHGARDTGGEPGALSGIAGVALALRGGAAVAHAPAMWAGAMRQFGGEFEGLSRLAGNHKLVWGVVEFQMKQHYDNIAEGIKGHRGAEEEQGGGGKGDLPPAL
jgi:putative transcriptional regulator